MIRIDISNNIDADRKYIQFRINLQSKNISISAMFSSWYLACFPSQFLSQGLLNAVRSALNANATPYVMKQHFQAT